MKKIYLAQRGTIERAVNTLSGSVEAEIEKLKRRVKILEEKTNPFFNYHLHSFATPQTFSTTTNYAVFCDMTIHREEGDGDYYLVFAVVQVSFPATGAFSLRLTDGTTSFYECVDLDRANHGTEVLMTVHKPNKGKTLTYQVEAKRDSGIGDISYVSHGMFAIRGYSKAEA